MGGTTAYVGCGIHSKTKNYSKMKKINLILFGFMLLLVGTGCEKDRNFVEFADLETGAYARELSREGSFFLTDIANSQIDIAVEFYDINQGQDVSSYSWTVSYIDKANGGADNAGPADILSIDASQFGTSPSGLPGAEFSFTLQQALDALGLTAADVNGGSTLRFNATVTMKDGRTFTIANTGNNIISSAAFRALFAFDADLLCTSDLEGIYDAQTTGWCGDDGPTIQVQFIATGPGLYKVADPNDPDNVDAEDFSFGAYTACYGPGSTLPGGDLRLKDACNIIAPTGVSRWGEVYTFEEVSVSGNVLTIVWTNDYGEGGTSRITRTDGTDWPPLTN